MWPPKKLIAENRMIDIHFHIYDLSFLFYFNLIYKREY